MAKSDVIELLVKGVEALREAVEINTKWQQIKTGSNLVLFGLVLVLTVVRC